MLCFVVATIESVSEAGIVLCLGLFVLAVQYYCTLLLREGRSRRGTARATVAASLGQPAERLINHASPEKAREANRPQFRLKDVLVYIALLCAFVLAPLGRAPVELGATDALRLWEFTGKRVTVHGIIGHDANGFPVLMVDGGGPVELEAFDLWSSPGGSRVVATGTLMDHGAYGSGLRLKNVRIRDEQRR